MEVGTRSQKSLFPIDDDKPSSQEDLITLVHSLTQKVDSLTSAWARDLAELTTYRSQHPTPSAASQSRSYAYEKFLQAPHFLANNGPTLLPNGSNYPFWLEVMNTTLYYIFESNAPINNSPAFLTGQPRIKDQAITCYLAATLHPELLPHLASNHSPVTLPDSLMPSNNGSPLEIASRN
ncbi:hypothetical protein O181_007147 [Austropuccinia psidii MF-1]|uniref:Uncharacterized protein n=1 Tax=Austropuccinia psidii MF-1 TaxID=1389203 RepID=A0A9Q3BM62_9BASI|nr:hypothetical protein [Austropuccinia psidii MF-1]